MLYMEICSKLDTIFPFGKFEANKWQNNNNNDNSKDGFVEAFSFIP